MPGARQLTPLSPEQAERALGCHALARSLARRFGPAAGLDPEEAEGVAALTLCRAAGTYRPGPDARFATYAFRAIRLAFRRRRRDLLAPKRRGDRRAVRLGLAGGLVPGPARSAEEAVAGAERVEALLAALAALPPKEAEAIRLTALEGLTRPEAAARLGVPVGTVDSRRGRGLAALRRRVERS